MARTCDTPALLVRSVAQGESDLLASFFTRDLGMVSARVRGGRASTKRFGGTLEPMHELSVTMEDKERELCLLKEARIVRPRTGIVTNLEAMEAAGCALRWTRRLCPARTPEPAVWACLQSLLDALDAVGPALSAAESSPSLGASERLVLFGLKLLSLLGYGLDLEACVRCGRPCPGGRSAFVDVHRGGLVCTGCGGASRTLSAPARQLALHAIDESRDVTSVITHRDLQSLRALIDDAMAIHAGIELQTPARH